MIPSSTYRIQFSSATTLQQGAELVPYLDALGAGAVYASPLLESGAGSNHGYDVVDPTRISGERGGEEGRRALVAAARERGLGFLLIDSQNTGRTDVMVLSIVLLAVLGKLSDSLFGTVERRLLAHRS